MIGRGEGLSTAPGMQQVHSKCQKSEPQREATERRSLTNIRYSISEIIGSTLGQPCPSGIQDVGKKERCGKKPGPEISSVPHPFIVQP